MTSPLLSRRLLTPEQRADILERARQRALEKHPDFRPEPKPTPCSPDCDKCHGAGWFTVPAKFGNEIKPCPNIKADPSKFRVTWENVRPVGNIHQAVNAIQETLQAGSGWVYLHGQPGNGKTLCLRATVADVRAGGAKLTDMLAIMDDLRGAFDDDHGQVELTRRQARWIEIPVLLIDEFDRFKATDFAVERLWRIMDGRYQRATDGERSITIMASNQPTTTYDHYMRSRLEDGRFRVIEVRAPDLRPGMGSGVV